ncbi:MAG: DUF2155 domain-containing protein [Minwuiales bacterium]|nr:DUF2155 domain-containing protein [Minwuiales bacterium]
MKRLHGLAAAVICVCLAGTAAAQSGNRVSMLRGLDKVTGRISTFEAPVNQAVRFGALEIIVRHCMKRPPEEPPETSAFLEISEIKPDDEPVLLFSGWMFASSPALSALEHAVYDVWVIDCTTAAPETPSGNE